MKSDKPSIATYRETALPSRMRAMLAVDPAAPALTFEGRTYSWSYYSDAVTALDHLLSEHPDAQRIGVVLRNRPGPMAAVVATLGTGRELVTLSPQLGDAGLAKDIADLSPDVLVAESDDWAREAVQIAAEKVGAIAVLSGSEQALASQPVDWDPSPSCEPTSDIAVLMMTSGTTGRPKRVALTYDRMSASFQAAGILDHRSRPHLRTGNVILWASLAHISGLYFAVAHVLEGRQVALLEKFTVEGWVDLVRSHRPGYLRLAPTALRMVLQADIPPDTFESVRAVGSGTAPLPPELAEAFEERYGVPVLGTYGATEFAGAIAGWNLKAKKEWGELKRGSVGRPFHGIELRVVDRDSGAVLGPGEIGLLEARGSQLPGADGAWLQTTDLASIDADGFLFIHGRSDDAINRGGFKIPPSVIEEALSQHPAVDEASVVALPDDRLGEVPAVAVTLISPATEEELMTFLAERLTRYQRPVALKIVDDLPRTPSLKVSRPLVRERYFDARPITAGRANPATTGADA